MSIPTPFSHRTHYIGLYGRTALALRPDFAGGNEPSPAFAWLVDPIRYGERG